VGFIPPAAFEEMNYPEVSQLLNQKAQRRRRLARLSFEEKIAIVNKWRKLIREIRSENPVRSPRRALNK